MMQVLVSYESSQKMTSCEQMVLQLCYSGDEN